MGEDLEAVRNSLSLDGTLLPLFKQQPARVTRPWCIPDQQKVIR
ncbi:hypothetical protein [Sphingomonas sp. OTU376]